MDRCAWFPVACLLDVESPIVNCSAYGRPRARLPTGSSDACQVERVSWTELVATSQRAIHGTWRLLGQWAPDSSGRVITHYELLIWDERQAAGPVGMNRVS